MKYLLIFTLFTQSAFALFTPFTDGSAPLAPILNTKGQLVTHNGVGEVPFNACADGQILEYDSTSPTGIKCSAGSGGSGGSGGYERQTINLVASVPTTVTSTLLADIYFAATFLSSGELIELQIEEGASANEIVITSSMAITNLKVNLIGESL